MPALKSLFEEAGFFAVKTYINSGNILFLSDNTEAADLQKICQQLIEDRFGLLIPVAVISIDELAHALDNVPNWWDNDKESKHNAIFIIAPRTAEFICQEVGEAKPEYERVAYCGRVIFWTAPIKTFSRTRWSKIVSTSAYSSITIRNANTTKKLLQLAMEMKEEETVRSI